MALRAQSLPPVPEATAATLPSFPPIGCHGRRYSANDELPQNYDAVCYFAIGNERVAVFCLKNLPVCEPLQLGG
jgi:hypothetical protein